MDKNITQKKIAIFWDDYFQNNNFKNVSLNKGLYPFLELSNINGESNTISVDKIEKNNNTEFIILCFLTISFFSVIKYIRLFIKYPKNKKYLFLFEPKVVAPISYNKIIHNFFDKVFTWDDSLVDNKKYYKFTWPLNLVSGRNKKSFQEKKFLTLVNGNKYSYVKNELYSEREKIIRYLESKNIEFDLYGTNWDIPNLKQKIFGFKKFISYRGKVENKIDSISEYKFNICFENMKNTPGYITEKIWDSFMAGSVPIYWGASNIDEYAPNNCYIDFREFDNNYEKLIRYLETMNEDTYKIYLENIDAFLRTEKAQKWFDKKWAQDFLNAL